MTKTKNETINLILVIFFFLSFFFDRLKIVPYIDSKILYSQMPSYLTPAHNQVLNIEHKFLFSI